MELLRRVENWAAPFVLVMTAVLVVWAVYSAHGLGEIMTRPGKFTTTASFMKVFVPSLTAMIGFWATLSLNMPDFTRFGRSQREQMVGQVIALPTTMTLFSTMAVVITSASAVIYGEAIWDPVTLVGKFSQAWIVAVAMFTIVVATLAVNIAANVVSPANDFAKRLAEAHRLPARWPPHGCHRRAHDAVEARRGSERLRVQVVAGLLGGPRRHRGRAHRRLLLRATKDARPLLAVHARRRVPGIAAAGTPSPVVATLLGCAVAWSGAFVPAFARLFDYAWFVGFFLSGGVYLALTRRPKP